MLKGGVHSPLTSSAGRLFDAVAALLGLRQIVRFEGQAAMELEFAIAGIKPEEAYPFELLPGEAGRRVHAGRGLGTHREGHFGGPEARVARRD